MTNEDGDSPKPNPLAGIDELLKLLLQLDPKTVGANAIENTRRLIDEISAAITTFTSTMENLNATAIRLNDFMDQMTSRFSDDGGNS